MRDLRNATAVGALRRENREWLAALPKTMSFQTLQGGLLLCHGIGEDDMAMLREDDMGYALEFNLPLSELRKSKRYSFVVNGHSHEYMVRRIGKILVVNAGTLSRQSRQSCSIIDFETRCVEMADITGNRIVSTKRYSLDASCK